MKNEELRKRIMAILEWNDGSTDKHRCSSLLTLFEEEAHKTEDGWCCACEADIAFLEGRIRDELFAYKKDLVKWIKSLKQPFKVSENMGERDAYNFALQDIITHIEGGE